MSAVFRPTAAVRFLSTGHEGWIYQTAKRPHTHDVRLLLMLTPAGTRPLMVSAGVDTQLMVHTVRDFAEQHPTRLCRVPQPPLVCCPPAAPRGRAAVVADQNSAAAFVYTAERDHVDVWRVFVAPQLRPVRLYVSLLCCYCRLLTAVFHAYASRNYSPALLAYSRPVGKTPIPLWQGQAAPGQRKAPQQLIRLTAKGGGHIVSVCGSADGRFVAFSDAQRSRLLELNGAPQGTVTSVKRHSLPAELATAHMMCFTASPSTWTGRARRPKLLLVAADGSLTMYDISSRQTQHVFPTIGAVQTGSKRTRPEPPVSRRASEQMAPPLSAITVSADGRRAAIAAVSQVQSGPISLLTADITARRKFSTTEGSASCRRSGFTTWCTAGWTRVASRRLPMEQLSQRLHFLRAAARLPRRQREVTFSCIRCLAAHYCQAVQGDVA